MRKKLLFLRLRELWRNSLSMLKLDKASVMLLVLILSLNLAYADSIVHDTEAEFDAGKALNRVESIAGPQVQSAYQEVPADEYTVALWHMNNNWNDSSGNSHTGTANGNAAFTTSSRLGSHAGTFDGTGDYVTVPDSDDWTFGSGDFTIDFWVKRAATGAQTIFGQSNSGANYTPAAGYFTAADKIQVYFYSGTTQYQITSTQTITDTTLWHHVAMGRNSDNGVLYIDGVQSGTVSLAGITLNNSTTDFSIGKVTDGTTSVNGQIDEFRILKGRALTPEEIKAAASRRPYGVYTSDALDLTASIQTIDSLQWTENGVQTADGETLYSSTNLVAQWNFNETSGTTASVAAGSCGASCNGTLTNFASTASQDQAAGTGWTANNKRWGAGALMFDGSNDYVSVADSDNFDFGNGAYSIDLWVKFNSLSGDDTFYEQYVSATSYIRFTRCNGCSVGATDTLTIYARDGGTAYAHTYLIWTPIIGTWYHLAVTREAATTQAKLFINGIEQVVSHGQIDSSSIPNYAASVTIGARSDGTNLLNGIVDSTRIYKGRALSAAEILSNYNAGNIEFQTRSGTDTTPDDGSGWEAWKPTTSETQLLSMDSDAANWSTGFSATGGTITYSGGYTIHTFTSSGTFAVTGKGNVEVLVVAGGGGGGGHHYGGGGGGGGVISNTSYSASGNITVTVGAGGAGAIYPAGSLGTQGSNSVFGTLTAIGGGAGNAAGAGGGGGSGGGGGCCGYAGGAGTAGQGFAGGAGAGTGDQDATGGGGGGAGAVGANSSAGSTGGNGGNGLASSISGSSSYYAGGGGGGISVSSGGTPGSGGLGGGGNAIAQAQGANGVANTGGGGGGGSRVSGGGTGGSGIVIVRYPTKLIGITNESNIKAEGTGSTKLTLGQPQIDDKTVGLWHFEETSGTGAYLQDETANNNDATLTGTTVVDGIFGKARKFNGTSDYLSAADSANWNLGSSFSIDFWVNLNSLNEIHWLGHLYYDGVNPPSGWYIYNALTGPDLKLRFYTNNNTEILAFTHGMTVNTWYHVAYTGDGTNLKLYINGMLKGTAALSSVQNPAQTRPLIIGTWTHTPGGAGLTGILDELRILKGRAFSADEIAETYRMGANHRISRTITSADLSGKTKLPFYVAADRPGTYLEATIGESAHANYYLDNSTIATNTVLYIKGDEIASSTAIKDSSFSGKAITVNGDAKIRGVGKIGNSVYFDGTGDWLTTPSSSDFSFGSGDFAIDMWVYPTSNPNAITGVMGLGVSGSDSLIYTKHSASSGNMQASMRDTVGVTYIYTTTPISLNVWQHIALVRNGNNLNFYLNSNLIGSADVTGKTMAASASVLAVGIDEAVGAWPFLGYIDEVRVIKGSTLTADQIRQAYEYGLRSHPITIDFAAKLNSADLITGSGDTSFTVDATAFGFFNAGDNLYVGDKVIVRENVGGTEYIAQGTVTAVTASTGAVTVASWDAGGTFPTGGYTANARVFKWQREWFDLTGSLSTHRDAITNLTLRPTNGAEGRTVYLDDFNSAGAYLTNGAATGNVTSTAQRYFQYRFMPSAWDTAVTPYISGVTVNYTANTAPNTPSLVTPVDIPSPFTDFATYGRTLNLRPKLVWTIPSDTQNQNLHFKVYYDTSAGSTLVANSATSVTGFEYYNGTSWVAFPAAGVTSTYYANNARYKPQADLTSGGTTYYWKIIANDGSLDSTASSVRHFVLGGRTWTDATITAGTTLIRKTHIDELREEANYARNLRNMADTAWTDPTITAGTTLIRKTHIDEIRTAIEQVAPNSGESTPTWTDPTLTADSTLIRKTHIDEPRAALGNI